MSVVAAAVVGSAVVGAYSSNQAAKKQADSAKSGLKQTAALSAQSRDDAQRLYAEGAKAAKAGLTGAFDFYKKAAPSRYQPVLLGNQAAQGVIGQGAVQANNAILGNPVDMSFAQPQAITPDLSFIQNAQLPAETALAPAQQQVGIATPNNTNTSNPLIKQGYRLGGMY